jgi:DNA-binding NarL/FixJ family response regulator
MELADCRTEQEPSRIIVVDDHPLFRSAIRHILEEYSDLEVVGEAANGQEAVELCRRLRPELVLMDLKMPVMDGVAATGAIKRKFPDTLVLILTAVDESVGLSKSLEAGAAGYVLKDAPVARITDAVRRVLAGEYPLNEELAMRLLMSLMNRGTHKQKEPLGERGRSRPDDSLTPREIEILRLVVRG